MGGAAKLGQSYRGADWATKEKPSGMVGNLFFENLWGGDEYTKNQEFGRTHPDAAPPAKGQTYDSFTKAYGDAHPQKVEPIQAAPEKSNTSTISAPSLTEPQKTYSAPQGMTNANAPKAPGAAAAPTSPAATPQSPVVSPQAAQLPQGALAARAANQMAGASQQKQFQLPSVGQISFGGS